MKTFLKNTNKVIRSLLFLYTFQLLLSACTDINDCNCSPAKTYEISNTDFDLNALDTSGFQVSEINGTVNKNAFGIRLNLYYNFDRIAKVNPKNNVSELGFSSTYACSCVPDEFIPLNTIEAIKITVTDTETQNTQDVTTNFNAFVFGDAIDLTDMSDLQNDDFYYWSRIEQIELELKEENSIPNSAIFTVEIVLSPSDNLVKQTEIINFE